MISKEAQAARADRLLSDGLRRIREGKVPTKVQLPYVQTWLAERDNEAKALREALKDAQIDKEILDGHYRRLVATSNTAFHVLWEFGISLHSKADDNHGWEGKASETTGGQEGYGSFKEALRAALKWRIGQGGSPEQPR